MADATMSERDDIIPISEVRIRQGSNSNAFSDALYSNSIESEACEEQVVHLQPHYYLTESALLLGNTGSDSLMKDAVSSGTFGSLIRKSNSEEQQPLDRAEQARQRVRYNLRKVGPQRQAKSGDRCEAWRKYLF